MSEEQEMEVHDLKVVIVGDGGCGKTVLLYAYTKEARDQFSDEYIPTVLESYSAEVEIGNKRVKLEIFDTAGQEDFENIRKVVYPGSHVFMMCYDCISKPSLQNVKEFWYTETKATAPRVPIVLVGNKLDLKETNPATYIAEEKAIEVMNAIGAKAQIQCSGREEALGNGSGKVDRAFKLAIKYGLQGKLTKTGTICGCQLL